jgi:hypothetical protein
MHSTALWEPAIKPSHSSGRRTSTLHECCKLHSISPDFIFRKEKVLYILRSVRTFSAEAPRCPACSRVSSVETPRVEFLP